MFDEGEEITTEIIQSKIRQMVESESSGEPLTDNEIIEIFRTHGVRISQRAVAKYRDQMQIPDADKRRKVM